MPKVNPELLSWARRTAALAPDDAVEKIGLGPAYGRSAVERLRELEAGEAEPSVPLLRRMAKQYKRPLLSFYLPNPPLQEPRGSDFRTLANVPPRVDALTDTLVREILTSQAIIRSALEAAEDDVVREFVGSASIADGVPGLVKAIREQLAIEPGDIWGATNPDELFKNLRERCESVGVFVVLKGNLGTYHTDLPVDVFRGFALSDPVAPFIVINENDARTAWSFSLIHELVHLWLGQTGISAYSTENKVEKFCNDVASIFLLPRSELKKLTYREDEDLETVADRIASFAYNRNISSTMVAYRLLGEGRIGQTQWEQLRENFRQLWRAAKEERKGRAGAGGSYYVTRRHRLGHAMLDTTSRLLYSGSLSTARAGRALGVKPSQVGVLLGLETYAR